MSARRFALQPQTQERISAIADRWEVELLEVALTQRSHDFDVLVRLGELYSRVGRWQDGLAVDLRLVAMAPIDPIVHYNLACSLALTGQVEQALSALVKAVRLGYDELDHLLADADLAAVRSHPTFPDVLRLLEKKKRASAAE